MTGDFEASERETAHRAEDGKELFVRVWEPAGGRARGAVQIVHGLAEHGGRYAHLGRALAERGFVVVASDHRGHGETDPDARGHIPGRDGFAQMAADLASLSGAIRREHSGAPLAILGHSLGSALALRAAADFDPPPDALILSGPPAAPRAAMAALGGIAALAGRVLGEARESPGLNALWSGPARLKFRPRRTDFDWLSRDPDQVDAYVADPACGFLCSRSFYRDMFRGIAAASGEETARAIAARLVPTLIFAGAEDPIGFSGAAPRRLARALRRAGGADLALRLYEGGRHEMLNDVERPRVVGELLEWLEARAARADEPTQKPIRRISTARSKT